MFKRISRRTLLRGAGAAMALPWLEVMAPLNKLGAATTDGLKLTEPPMRMGFLFMPNGVRPELWNPPGRRRNAHRTQPSPEAARAF